MDEPKLKRYIVIGLIVLINIILIIFVCISVMKSINRIESGSTNNVNNSIGEESVASSTEDTNYIENDEVQEMDISFGSIFKKISKNINAKVTLQGILLLIGINLVILSIIVYRKLK